MAIEIVGQHAHRPGGGGDLLQGVAQLLLGRRVLAEQGRVRVLEQQVGGPDRLAKGGDNPNLVRVSLSADEVATFKKGIL